MQTLILVKHSLPEIDPSVPANEWRLSCEGRRRARKLGERLDRSCRENLAIVTHGTVLSLLVSRNSDQEQIALRFASQDVRIIQYKGIDVGYFSTSATVDRVRIYQIFILPEYQRKGLGSACMNRTVADAHAQGKDVTLHVLKINTRATSFYLRLGFEIVDEDDTHVQMVKSFE